MPRPEDNLLLDAVERKALILMDQYQDAAHAAGTGTVYIPAEDLLIILLQARDGIRHKSAIRSKAQAQYEQEMFLE